MILQESWESGEILLSGTTLHFFIISSPNPLNVKALPAKFFSL